MTLSPDRVHQFFAVARERHSIDRARYQKLLYPWTKDEILQKWRVSNVYRELDKTTIWFSEHVREPMRSNQRVLLATVVFRLFNRIDIGEAIFSQQDIGSGLVGPTTAWEQFLVSGDVNDLKNAILLYVGEKGPFVSSAYDVRTPPGLIEGPAKLTGVLRIIECFCEDLITAENRILFTLQQAHEWFGEFRFIDRFLAYEIVSDLRHTDMLNTATDTMTWAEPSKRTRRTIAWLHGEDSEAHTKGDLVMAMQELLTLSQDSDNWPRNWLRWEMREVETWCREFDKYRSAQAGNLRVKYRYKVAA